MGLHFLISKLIIIPLFRFIIACMYTRTGKRQKQKTNERQLETTPEQLTNANYIAMQPHVEAMQHPLPRNDTQLTDMNRMNSSIHT